MKYANAAKIFPKALLDEMRRYFPGGLIWVTQRDFDHTERAELVVQLREKGVPIKEVAALAEITPRHVNRILQKHRQAKNSET